MEETKQIDGGADSLIKHCGTLHRLAWHRLRYDRAHEAEPLYRLLTWIEPRGFVAHAGLAYALLLQGSGGESTSQPGQLGQSAGLARLRALAVSPDEHGAIDRLERRHSRLMQLAGQEKTS
ncbi:MAG: hypothetical protein OD811_06460 [Alphaproteobacteria bacterium]